MAIVNREHYKLHIDIVALGKTQLAENGSIREKNYTFFWKRMESELF